MSTVATRGSSKIMNGNVFARGAGRSRAQWHKGMLAGIPGIAMGLEATGLDLTPDATPSALWVLQKC